MRVTCLRRQPRLPSPPTPPCAVRAVVQGAMLAAYHGHRRLRRPAATRGAPRPPHRGYSPMCQKLQPHAPRLRPHAPRLRPHAHRLRPSVPRRATPSASRSCYSPPTRGRSSSSSGSAAPLSSPSCAISSSRGPAPPGRCPPHSPSPPIPPPPSPPAHRTAPRARRVAVPARLQVQLISYLLWLYLPRLQVQLIFYSVFSSHIEVAFTITCDTAVGVRANAPSTSLLRVPATLTPRHPCSAGRAAV